MDSMHEGAGVASTEGHESSPKTFLCPKCPNEFNFKWKLTAHFRRSHNEMKPIKKRKAGPLFFTCDTCDWSFGSHMSLKYHVKTKHATQGISFVCPKSSCDKVYYLFDKLMSHVKTQHQHLDLSSDERRKLEEMKLKEDEKERPMETADGERSNIRKTNTVKRKKSAPNEKEPGPVTARPRRSGSRKSYFEPSGEHDF
jgi:uncharacterized C2H2 Zn-finger protein